MAVKKRNTTNKLVKAALALRGIGWIPFPLLPNSNILAVEMDQWQDELTDNGIRRYWRLHPDHGLGFIEDPRNKSG
jgi:hypothetical protein